MFVFVCRTGEKNHIYCLKIEDPVKIKILFNQRSYVLVNLETIHVSALIKKCLCHFSYSFVPRSTCIMGDVTGLITKSS